MGVAGTASALSDLSFDLPGHHSGKVRESWQLSRNRRLIVTSDRLSAFDRVVGLVPHKGQVLNQLAAWWFESTADIVANHLIEVPDPNVLIAVDAEPLPIEVVVRGRLTGSTSTSLLPRYLDGEREMYGHQFPDGLEPHGELPTPIITPTTKAEAGEHDRPITVDEVVILGLLDDGLWARIQEVALELYARGQAVAEQAGFVLADTKYEFGISPDGELLLIDEVHTPDSSRFWPSASLQRRLDQGMAPDGYDKEPVRLALKAAGYDGEGEPPALPDHVWTDTAERYVALYERITGRLFMPAAQPMEQRIVAAVASHLD